MFIGRTLRWFVVLVVVGTVVWAVFFAPKREEKTPTPVPTTAASETTRSTPDVTASPKPETPLSETEIAAARSLAEKAIHIYGSFPNPNGRETTLKKLSALVDPSVIDAVSAEWAGPDVTTASFQVVQVDFDQEASSVINDKLVLEAIASQQATFANTPAQAYLTTVRTTLERRNGTWVIVGLAIVDSGV